MEEPPNQYSRRGLLKGSLLAAGSVMPSQSSLALSDNMKRTGRGTDERVLALIGDRYHNSDYIRVSLTRLFAELNVAVDFTIAYEELSTELLRNYGLLVILRDGMVWPNGYLGPDQYTSYETNLETQQNFPDARPLSWMTDEQGLAIGEFVRSGKALYAMHNSSNISLSSKQYREVMGGAYIGHPPQRPFQVRPTENRHPITDGASPFIVNDEQHYVVYDGDPAHIILEAENVDGLGYRELGTKSISGWAHEFGKGRVAFTAVGHSIHTMWNPNYFMVQKRAVNWLLRRI